MARTLKDYRKVLKIVSDLKLNPLGVRYVRGAIESINEEAVNRLPDETELSEKAEEHLSKLESLVHTARFTG